MKYNFLLILLLCTSLSAISQEIKPQNAVVPFDKKMFFGVSRIFVPNQQGFSIGTMFCVQYNKKIYGVTAAHIFSSYNSGDSIKIKIDNGIEEFESKITLFYPVNIDIAMFELPRSIPEIDNLIPTLDPVPSIRIGDPVAYVGFPSVQTISTTVPINSILASGRRAPLLKRGYVSGGVFDNPLQRIFIIDSQNLTGFSGSPVYLQNGEKLQIIGVLCGGYNANITITTPNNQIPMVDAHYMTSLSYVFSIDYAIDIINQLINKF